MKKWNMIVDVANCNNCRNCFISVKDEHCGNEFPGYAASQPLHEHNWLDIERIERGQRPVVDANFRPVMCNHCDDAPCMAVAENGAITKRDDGIVIIDPVKSKNQKQIVEACPYGAVYWNEELQIPQAWIFDAHLLDHGWTQTRAEQSCATGVFKSLKVEDEEMQKIAKKENLQVLNAELNTKPRVYYKNNHLFESIFIAGTLVTRVDGQEECVEGATINITNNGNENASTVSDAFGEFKIDKLTGQNGHYTLEILIEGKAVDKREVETSDSIYLGCIEV